MGIFTRQTTRSFAIGFLLGAIAVAAMWSGSDDKGLANRMIPAAIAAQAD